MSTKFLLAAVTALQLLQGAAANADSDRIEPDQVFEDSSHCQFIQACDRSTPGTGHKYFTGNLTEDLITVERCYSFCFKNFSSSSGSGGHFPNIFTGDPCSANNKDAFVCYAACLFSAKDALKRILPGLSVADNATCEHYCQLKDGICERAFPPNSSCVMQCKLETCPVYCRHVMDEFPNTTGPVNSGSVGFTMEFASNISLRRQGVLEFQPTLSGATPADGSVFGLVWKVTHPNGFVAYIPQHLPFLLLPDEVGPLYRIGSNMLAIRDLQCYNNMQVEAAVVTQFGVGNFSSPHPQCFYGNWHPRPPAGINMTLGFSRETGNLKFEVTAETLSPDDEYVTGYGVQVLEWYDGDDVDCTGTTQNVRATGSVDFPNKEDLHLTVDDTDRVFELFPGLSSRHACAYWIGVYALPQKENNAAGQPIPYRGGYWQKSYVEAPKFPDPTWNQTFNLERDHVTGLVAVTYTLTLTSHWKSIAILGSIEGLLNTQPRDYDHVVIKHYRHKISGVTPSRTRYDFVLRNVPPFKENVGAYLFLVNYVTKTALRERGFTIKNTDSFAPGVVVLPPHPPGPPRNLTFNFYLDFETNTFKGNATWLGPEMPEGKLIEYRYVLSSASASTIVGGTISVEGTSAATDMSEENFVSFSADLTEQEYFNFSVQAVSKWGAALTGVGTYGEWANVSVYPDFPEELPASGGLPKHVEGIIIGASVLAVILVVAFILLTVTAGYYYYRKNKVVIVKNTRVWINGRQEAEEGDEEEDDFQPVPVDSWEISPDCIIMDTMLGEGQFGEVYKGLIKDGDVNNPYFKGSECVAVKILRPEANAALKSDFLKEIATMKKITMGNCPYVVNMVGCCTLQEPLALVLEYIPNGDLLTYLRTIRKLKNTTYFNLPSPDSTVRAKGNEYVNHIGTNATTPLTPMTPASDCPLLVHKDGGSPPTTGPPIPSPYENPYSSLGELRPIHLISFAYQISRGMEFLSELGIVHRDLACRNVLVGENKVLKISDFGMARDEDIYIKTTDGKLPLRWMAVESIVDRVFTTKSDVWSFGVVLWEITTLGGHPYPSIGNKALLTHLLRGYRMDKPENCSADIYDIMQKCWVADNRKRPSFTELRATFDAMLSNAQNATYIDLNVDEMLPYYSMNAAEQGEDGEVTEEDLHPTLVVVGGDDDDNKGGYPDTKGLRNSALLRSIEKLEEGDDDSSIASADVAVLDSAGEATAGVEQHEVVRCKGEGEGEERDGDQHST